MLFNKLALALLSLIAVAAALPSPPAANADKRSPGSTIYSDVTAVNERLDGITVDTLNLRPS